MDQHKWMTMGELANYLKMGQIGLCRMDQACDTPPSKTARQWRFDREEVDEWMRKQQPAPASSVYKGAAR